MTLCIQVFITDMYRLTTSNGNCSCTGSDGSTSCTGSDGSTTSLVPRPPGYKATLVHVLYN